MLLNLHVKNLAIIDEVEVYFTDHLNILTGETGAGKSIIIGSINIALGGKFSKDMIRKGADYALVELAFHLDEDNIIEKIKSFDLPVEDGQIIISRKIMNGRSISKVNGENVTAAVLKEISGFLIDIHGQHEHQSLLYKNRHLEIVDRFAKDKISRLLIQIENSYKEYMEVKRELEHNLIDEDKRLREISFLEYEISEIEEAKLVDGEDEKLSEKYKKLSNANAIVENLSISYELTGEGSSAAAELVGRAVKQVSRIAEYDKTIENFYSQLLDIENLLCDYNREVMGFIDGVSFEQEEFAQIEERLNLINHLKAKYGNTLEEIQAYYDNSMENLTKYMDYDNYVLEQKKRLKELETKLDELCSKLSIIRQKQSDKLTKKIREALLDLNFLDVRFEMRFKKLNYYTSNGFDEAEFMISTNPGEEIMPLSKVASGGELSRIMLAIKSVLADKDAIHTLIFDEIDVGVSGRTAQKVSEKLSFISKNHQVLCITHLPQITAMSDAHYIIEKSSDNRTTTTDIRKLTEDESVNELARILGGAKITDAVLASAKEMKELAEHTKQF